VSAYDPVVKELPDDLSTVRIATDVYDAADRADAVVLVTEWPAFRDIDAEVLRGMMKGDFVLDGRNLLSEAAFASAGVRLEGFGW
jgi:UDP-glucose 6-dehydrogenase